MIGQSAPTSDVAQFVEQIATMSRRLRELELASAVAPTPDVYAGAFSGTTGAVTSNLVVTHNLGLPTPYAVAIQPISPNGGSANDRWVGWNVTAATSDTFTIGRCISQDGSLLTDTAVTGRFVAVPY